MVISCVTQMVLCSVTEVLNNLQHSYAIKIKRKSNVKTFAAALS